MPDKSCTDPLRSAKGKIPGRPQSKTSNPITSPVAPGSRLSARTHKQNQLRELMENSAEDIIHLLTIAIKTGKLEDEKISNSMRLDLMKSFLPYVIPQLKSVEYVEQKTTDLQPLVIHMNGGEATIKTDGKKGKTEIELKGAIEGAKEDPKIIN